MGWVFEWCVGKFLRNCINGFYGFGFGVCVYRFVSGFAGLYLWFILIACGNEYVYGIVLIGLWVEFLSGFGLCVGIFLSNCINGFMGWVWSLCL
jgi:hypothetical protein